jgi:hypothetical protein
MTLASLARTGGLVVFALRLHFSPGLALSRRKTGNQYRSRKPPAGAGVAICRLAFRGLALVADGYLLYALALVAERVWSLSE